LPAIAAAGLKELYILYAKTNLDAHGWSVLAVGILVGSISAFVAIWTLMRVLERFSSWPFVLYRGFMGGALLTAVWLGLLQ
jgi:undecaprenyl-diphosphatase